MAKPVPSKKVTVNRKAVSAVTLAVLIALTVIFVFLGFTGRNMDAQGLYKLLPWLPSTGTEARWRETLVPGAELGENLVLSFKAEAENPLTDEEKAQTIRVLYARLGDLGWRDAKVEEAEDGALRVTVPRAADDGHLEHLLNARGHFTFTDPEGSEFLSGEHIVSARFDMTDQAGTNFSLSIAFDEEGKRIFGEKTAELVGKSITLNLDGNALVSPGVNMPMTEGAVSIPGFTRETALEYAVMLRSGAQPYALQTAERTEGAPLLGEKAPEKLVAALLIVFALAALFLIIRQRLGGLVAAWMLLLQLALSYFFAALIRAGFTIVTLSAIWMGFLVVLFSVVVLFENVREDIRRGRSVRQAVKESYAGRGHAALDAMAALLVICVVTIIIDAHGVVGDFSKVLGISLLIGLLLTQVALRLILGEALTLFGDHSGLYTGGVMKKEEA